MPDFLPAVDLCRSFYNDVVRPIVGYAPHGAALIGPGSDVLGFDTARSTDHFWGPRVILFIEDAAAHPDLRNRLDTQLPQEFQGWPVRFGWDDVAPRHHVVVTTLSQWMADHVGGDPAVGMTTVDWLVTPQQKLLSVTAGAVFADDDGAVTALLKQLEWYPDEIWRWLVACQWRRLAQEEAFVARTAEVGDETGSAVTAARLVRDAMRLALLLDRRYAPYQKWLGTALARSTHPDHLPRHLDAAVHASDAAQRESALAAAYGLLAARHNATGITGPVDERTRSFHSRPAQVLLADRFVDACLATITDDHLRALPLIGNIDQTVDSTDVLQHPAIYRRFATLYGTHK